GGGYDGTFASTPSSGADVYGTAAPSSGGGYDGTSASTPSSGGGYGASAPAFSEPEPSYGDSAAAYGAPAPVAENPGPAPTTPPVAAGTVAKAAVPVASRIAPPAEAVPPSRGTGRVYGSTTSQPVTPAPEATGPASQSMSSAEPGPVSNVPMAPPAPAPAAYGSPAPGQYGTPTMQPEQPSAQIPAQAGPPSRPAQASARASVSVGRVSPAEVGGVPQTSGQPGVYGAPAQPTVYGGGAAAQPGVYGSAAPAATPTQPSAPEQPPAPMQPPVSPAPAGRGAGMSAYSDLMGPPQAASAPPTQPTGTQSTGGWGDPAPAAAPPSIPQQRPAGVPPQQPTQPTGSEQNRFDKFTAEPEPAPSKGGTAKVLVMVIAACVLLIGVAFGVLFAVNKVFGGGSDSSLAVGQCVQRSGNSASVVDCGSAGTGSFKIVKKVADQKDCPNPQNDALTQGSDIYCLEPLS
ncbi:MAG: hypothetical protein HOU81_17760, partial [Hamadaea sp.]|nr:hypothetical protein [Hamadaea sp.]